MTQLLVSGSPTSHQVKSCGLPIALAVGAIVGTRQEGFLLPLLGLREALPLAQLWAQILTLHPSSHQTPLGP